MNPAANTAAASPIGVLLLILVLAALFGLTANALSLQPAKAVVERGEEAGNGH
ncbi:hypothetical protein IIA16_02665 [bacterium]|nr:hypothetical protein [bacterium]